MRHFAQKLTALNIIHHEKKQDILCTCSCRRCVILYSVVPLSNSEAYAEMERRNSSMPFFGPTTLFHTVAPNDIDIKLSFSLSKRDTKADIQLPEVIRPLQAVSKCLMATPCIFERQVRAFLEVLPRLSSSNQPQNHRAVCNRKKRLVGTGVAVQPVTSVNFENLYDSIVFSGLAFLNGCSTGLSAGGVLYT